MASDDGVKFDKMKIAAVNAMPGVSFAATAVVEVDGVGPRLLLHGGQRRGLSKELWVFEAGDGWTQLHPEGASPSERTQATMTTLNDLCLLFGGFVLNVGETNEVWNLQLVPGDGTLEAACELLECNGEPPAPRYGHSATAAAGQLVVFGGQDSKVQFNDVACLSPDGFAWSQPVVSGLPPSVRTRHTACAVADTALLVVGGFNREARVLADFYTLTLAEDFGTAEWAEVTPEVDGDGMPPRAQHAAAVEKGHALLFGGYDGTKNLCDLWVLDLPNQVLREIKCAPPPEARCRHAIHYIGAHLHVVGGYDGSKPHAGDVWVAELDDPAGALANKAVEGAKKPEAAAAGEGDDE